MREMCDGTGVEQLARDNGTHGTLGRRVIHAVFAQIDQRRGDRIRFDVLRLQAREQHALPSIEPGAHIRKRGVQRSDDGIDLAGPYVMELEPLLKYSTWAEMMFRKLIEFAAVEIGGAGEPNAGQLDGDLIVLVGL